jgi:predicted phosphodiesterase
MSTEPFKWLHISDLHFKSGENYDQDVVTRAFINSLPNLLSRYGPIDAIFVTGDVAYSGKEDEYDIADVFFQRIIETTGVSRENIFIVPGNHDVQRSEVLSLSTSLSSQNDADRYFSKQSPLLHFTNKFRNFVEWHDRFFFGICKINTYSSCMLERIIHKGQKTFGVALFNSALFCNDDNDHGNLWIGRRTFDDIQIDKAAGKFELSFAAFHHPLDWNNPIEKPNIRSILGQKFDIILTGHLHDQDSHKRISGSDSAIHLAAGALYQTRKWPNTAMLCCAHHNEIMLTPLVYNDSPSEVWTVDPSQYPENPTFQGRIKLGSAEDFSQNATLVETHLQSSLKTNMSTAHANTNSLLASAQSEFEQDLFLAPNNEILYAQPRIMDKPQEAEYRNGTGCLSVPISEIVDDSSSYVIEARTEYGSTSLAKRLVLEYLKSQNKFAIRKDSRNLPNYRKKLELEFPTEIQGEGLAGLLILDNFDYERDERLIKEILSTKWFDKIIIVSVARTMHPQSAIKFDNNDYSFKHIYLWGIERSEVRKLTETLFNSKVDNFISSIVEKVYSDLLNLCIPITPSNVIMYLKILHKEDNFHPINRVDILSRYINEILRKPSDAYQANFNSKNKIDVIANFAYHLFNSKKSDFDEKYWLEFCKHLQDESLIDFDADELLIELLETRILIKYEKILYFKYSFFYCYFVGKYIESHKKFLVNFMIDEEYLRIWGIIDVITGISSDNEFVVSTLTEKLECLLEEFSEKYVKSEFDPLLAAIWPQNESDDEEIWEPIQQQIDMAPKSNSEIDLIKTSYLSESKTADQIIRFDKLTELENSLFTTTNLLSDALRNSEEISGILKLRALDAIFNSKKVNFQIGTILSPILAKRSYFRWGGIAFIDFNIKKDSSEITDKEAMLRVVDSLSYSISLKLSEEIGTPRLGIAFSKKKDDFTDGGYLSYLNFSCIIRAKGQNWYESAKNIIERTDKNAYYLALMLGDIVQDYRNEVGQLRDKENLKLLIALIRAKRAYKKQIPGNKMVRKVLEKLERRGDFSNSEEGVDPQERSSENDDIVN